MIAGGDTSSYTVRALEVEALEMIASISPGVPLCKCISKNSNIDGLEISLKSGQFGQVDYFGKVVGQFEHNINY